MSDKKDDLGNIGGLMGRQRQAVKTKRQPFVAEDEGDSVFDRPKEKESANARSNRYPEVPPSPTAENETEQSGHKSNEHLREQAHGILASHRCELKQLGTDAITAWRFKDRNLEDLRGDESFAEILADVRAYGVIAPILARAVSHKDGTYTYEEIYGFKRVEAARIAKLATITTLVIYDLSDEDAMIIQRAENTGRSSPSAWNKAKSMLAFHKEANITFSDIEVSGKIGGNPKTINNLLRIARNMPEELSKSLNIHRLSQDCLKEIVGGTGNVEEHKDRKEFIELIINNAEKINSQPKQAKAIIARLKRDCFAKNTPTALKPNARELLLDNGQPAFSWKLNSKGGNLKIHPDILPHITEQDLERFANSIIKKRGKAS